MEIKFDKESAAKMIETCDAILSEPPVAGAASGSGVALIALERQRQVKIEGWTPEHDDKHTDMELGKAAESYLCAVITPDEEGDENGKSRPAWDWPWHKNWWKPSDDPIRNLVKAGALIAAEIDRLQRKASVPNR